MRRVMSVWAVLAWGAIVAAQAPIKTIEDGVLDHIELHAASLDSPSSLTVAIEPFDASTAELGTGGKDGKQTRQEEARTMQQEGPRVLAERFASTLKADGPFKGVVVLTAGGATPADAVVVSGRFAALDPGSRAKRYFAGFGAGKSAVEVVGTVKDSTGRTLATFRQRRVGAMGLGGGDSLGKLMSDSRSIGEDIATFLARWARGQALDD